jgi:hypothetical protein
MERQSAAKLLGKKKEFFLVSTEFEQKATYKKGICTVKCINCNTETKVIDRHLNRAICLICKSKQIAEKRVGQNIGIYKVLSFLYAKRIPYYSCQCSLCNTVSIVSSDRLKHNKHCKNCNIPGKSPSIEAQINFVKYSYKTGASKRNLEFLLTDEEFKEIIYKNCSYCGSIPIHKNPANTKILEGSFKINGIDRVNPNIGYIKSNCVPCCSSCNEMKMDRTFDEFKSQISKIHNYLSECSTTISEESTPK